MQLAESTAQQVKTSDKSSQTGGTDGRKKGNMFLIGHDIFLWSPKGFLTGSAGTPGSILFGINGGQFHRDRILLREWDLFYFVAPRMSVGAHVLWYDVSNLRAGRNQAAHNLNVCSTSDINSGNCRPGIHGDWVDVMLTSAEASSVR